MNFGMSTDADGMLFQFDLHNTKLNSKKNNGYEKIARHACKNFSSKDPVFAYYLFFSLTKKNLLLFASLSVISAT